MSVGILYESDEWSNGRLRDCLIQKGVDAEMIFMEEAEMDNEGPFRHALYVNRVFPSAEMRGNGKSIEKTDCLLRILMNKNVPTVNSYEAFLYDCSKWRTYVSLREKGYTVPETIFIDTESDQDMAGNVLPYPVVLKRDCSGRSYGMKIVWTEESMRAWKAQMACIPWVIQAYVEPTKGYTTRVEVVGGTVMTVLKRFLGRNGISSYSTGSRYEVYDDCPSKILEDAIAALDVLDIEMGSLDFIETEEGRVYLIDVNATSNFTPDYVPLLGFDPMEKMATYIVQKHNVIRQGGSSDR